MFRKLIIALGATAALAASVGSASAWHHHHKHYGWGAFGAGVALGALATPVVAGYPYGYAGSCYIVKRWVDTPFGPRLRRFTVCN
jgi:hypothetical protein